MFHINLFKNSHQCNLVYTIEPWNMFVTSRYWIDRSFWCQRTAKRNGMRGDAKEMWQPRWIERFDTGAIFTTLNECRGECHTGNWRCWNQKWLANRDVLFDCITVLLKWHHINFIYVVQNLFSYLSFCNYTFWFLCTWYACVLCIYFLRVPLAKLFKIFILFFCKSFIENNIKELLFLVIFSFK